MNNAFKLTDYGRSLDNALDRRPTTDELTDFLDYVDERDANPADTDALDKLARDFRHDFNYSQCDMCGEWHPDDKMLIYDWVKFCSQACANDYCADRGIRTPNDRIPANQP